MSDWLDDLYESGGSYTTDIETLKKQIRDLIIEEFDIKRSAKVRFRWVIETKLEIIDCIYSSDLLEIYYSLLETGRYNGQLIKYNGRSDILMWRKSWQERNPVWDRFRTASISALFSLSVGLILWLLANQKQSRAEFQQDLRIDNLSDSVAKIQKYITDSARHK